MLRQSEFQSRLGAALGSVVLLALAGCGDADVAPVADNAETWLHAPQATDRAAVELPAWLVYPVAEPVLDEAIAELAGEPYVQLSPHMASRYAGQEVRVPAEMRPFLVRAVAPPGATVTVVQSNTGLWLRARGGDTTRAHRAPRVVLVDPTPVEIFVTVE
ncbi:MAG: hypothetical protein WD928_18155 [Gammaproteobacteria bacterium]